MSFRTTFIMLYNHDKRYLLLRAKEGCFNCASVILQNLYFFVANIVIFILSYYFFMNQFRSINVNKFFYIIIIKLISNKM